MNFEMIIVLFLSLGAGILINYLADVLPNTRKLSRAEWWPLSIGTLKEYISKPRVLLVLIAALGVGYWIAAKEVPGWHWLSLLLLFGYFGLLIVIDIEHQAILHPVSIAGAILMAYFGVGLHGSINTLLGGVLGFAFIFMIYWAGSLFANWLAKRRGEALEDGAMGFGDVILAGVIGLLLGWPGVISGLILGIFFAGIYSAIYIIWQLGKGKYQAFASIPLGPFLALGAIASILLGAYA